MDCTNLENTHGHKYSLIVHWSL